MGSNSSFYQNGLPLSTAETGLGNVPTGAPAPNSASSSFYLSGTAYTEADPVQAAASASAAAASAAAAAASAAAAVTTLSTALLKANNLSDLQSVTTAKLNLSLVKADVGLGNVNNTSDATKNSAVATLTNKTLTAPVINSPTGIVKADVGLGNVDNTADVNKPVSTAQDAADAVVAANAANASNLTSGTVAAARLPNPSATTLGGIQSLAAVGSKWINAISTAGVPSATQPAAADISGLGTAATQNTGTSGATIPFLNGSNSWSGTNQFNGAFATGSATPPNLTTTGIGGGAPQTSGTTDANQFLVAGNGTVQWRFGFYLDGTMWSQPSLQSSYASNFGTVLNPNGGNVGIGTGTTPGTLLTVAGPISTKAPTTKTANYTQVASDGSLIFNGAGSLTLTLLSAAAVPGQWLTIKTIAAFTVVSASSNVVPLIGGAASTPILAATAGKWARLQSDGTNWIVMEGN